MGLDLSDPKIAATYEEIRSGQNAIDWMVLSFLPKLPGVHTGDVLSVIASGPGGVNSFQEELGRLGDSAVYGFLKHDQRFFYVELIPEKPIGLARSTAVTYGKEIGGLLREHDAEVHVSSATELNSQLLVLQCKSSPGPNVLLGRSITSASNNSLSSDKNEDVSEDFARRLQDNAQVKQRLREKADGLLKTAADERSKEDQWFKQKRAKENEMKEDYMKQYKITQERTPKAAILSTWLDEAIGNGRFWKKRWMVVRDNQMNLFKDEQALKPSKTIQLADTAISDGHQEWYLPNVFILREKSGARVEYVFHTGTREDLLRCIAAVERSHIKT